MIETKFNENKNIVYHTEDITHIFFKCHIVNSFWSKVHLNGYVQNNFDGSSLEATNWMDCWKQIKHKKCSSHIAYDKSGRIEISMSLSTSQTPCILKALLAWQWNTLHLSRNKGQMSHQNHYPCQMDPAKQQIIN